MHLLLETYAQVGGGDAGWRRVPVYKEVWRTWCALCCRVFLMMEASCAMRTCPPKAAGPAVGRVSCRHRLESFRCRIARIAPHHYARYQYLVFPRRAILC